MLDIKQFWSAVLAQDRETLKRFLHEEAVVNWHCTNERFTAEEFIRVNCDYPGDWDGEVERVEWIGDMVITVTHVWPKDRSASFHAISFIRTRQGMIVSMDEYWADDGDAPLWRQALHIGRPIRKPREG